MLVFRARCAEFYKELGNRILCYTRHTNSSPYVVALD